MSRRRLKDANRYTDGVPCRAKPRDVLLSSPDVISKCSMSTVPTVFGVAILVGVVVLWSSILTLMNSHRDGSFRAQGCYLMTVVCLRISISPDPQKKEGSSKAKQQPPPPTYTQKWGMEPRISNPNQAHAHKARGFPSQQVSLATCFRRLTLVCLSDVLLTDRKLQINSFTCPSGFHECSSRQPT